MYTVATNSLNVASSYPMSSRKLIHGTRKWPLAGTSRLSCSFIQLLCEQLSDGFWGFRVFWWNPWRAKRTDSIYRVKRTAGMSEETSSPVGFSQTEPVTFTVREVLAITSEYTWRRAPFPYAASFGARWLVNIRVRFSIRLPIGREKVAGGGVLSCFVKQIRANSKSNCKDLDVKSLNLYSLIVFTEEVIYVIVYLLSEWNYPTLCKRN